MMVHKRVPLLLWSLGGTILAVGLGGGALVAMGKLCWGDGGWYYHPDPEYRLRYGQALLDRGDWDRADEIAGALAAGGHGDAAALLRGESLFRRAKPLAVADQMTAAAPLLNRALDDFLSIRDPGPMRLQAAALIGQCNLFLKNPREAEAALAYVLSESPDHLDAHRALAVLYADQGALQRAIWHLKQVARLDPHDGRPPRMIGLIHRQLMQWTQAIPVYQQALARDLSESVAEEVREELAECFIKNLDFTQAATILEECSPEARGTASFRALRAECLLGLARGQEAQALLDLALADGPRTVQLLFLRAKMHLEANEYLKAVDLLREALAIDPQDTSCRFQLVQAYNLSGQTGAAKEQQRQLREIEARFAEMTKLSHDAMAKPWDAAVRTRLAELCEQMGKQDMAQMWRRAAAVCAGTPVGPAAEQKVQVPPNVP